MKIISNLPNYNEQIVLNQLPIDGEIRKVISKILSEIPSEENMCFLNVLTVGRRILNNRSVDDVISLINGRKHRNYLVFRAKKRIVIKFAWYKIKYLTPQEKEFMKKNWHLQFFNNEGRHLVKQLNGVVFPEYVLNKYL